MNELIERLRQNGLRLTAQRRAVADTLVGDHVHLTAEAVFAAAQVALPEISMATVYNTLNEFVSIGALTEISTGSGAKRFDPNTATKHHHLQCIRCGTLRDVAPAGEAGLALSSDQRYGFEVLGVDIVFKGVCPSCATT